MGLAANGDPHFELFSRTMGGPLGRELVRSANLLVNTLLPAGTGCAGCLGRRWRTPRTDGHPAAA